MCWFNKKKKEQIEILENQVEILTNEICKLIEALEKIETKVIEHIENDKDMEQGDDEITWNGY